MKLSRIEISGFRGFRDPCAFDFPGGFVVITGRNGAGKSTLIDAVDFAVTGSINKFAHTTSRSGGLDEHIWWVGTGTPTEHFVSVTFEDDEGGKHQITRRRDSGLVIESDELKRVLCMTGTRGVTCETLMRTSIIRDELISSLSLDLAGQARFSAVRDALGALDGASHVTRMAELQRLADAALAQEEQRLSEARSELARRLNNLTEARSRLTQTEDLAAAKRLMSELLPGIPDAEHTRAGRALLARRRANEERIRDLLGVADQMRLERARLRELEAADGISKAMEQLNEARNAQALAHEKVEIASAALQRERELDDFATSFAELLSHGEQIGLQHGRCPLCDAEQTASRFQAAIEKGHAFVKSRNERISHLVADVELVKQAANSKDAEVAIAELYVDELSRLREKVRTWEGELALELAAYGVSINIDTPDEAELRLSAKRNKTASLERALHLLESTSLNDQVANLSKELELLRSAVATMEEKVERARRAGDIAKQLSHAAQSVYNQVLIEQFETVLPLLKELYLRLRPHAEWREIETDFGGKVRASLNFVVGEDKNPQFMFSSGQRRAAGLAFLIAVHLSREWCSWKSLLLDDPVQHIDDYRSLNLVEVLAAIRMSGRQVVIAVEDPLLAELMCRRLRSSLDEPGRLFEIAAGDGGAAVLQRQIDLLPLPRDVLRAVS